MSSKLRGAATEAPEFDVSVCTRDVPPEIWNVVFLNDDITTFDCVVKILLRVFGMKEEQALAFAKVVDALGWGIAGCYSKKEAESKRDEALSIARADGYPLEIKIERQI